MHEGTRVARRCPVGFFFFFFFLIRAGWRAGPSRKGKKHGGILIGAEGKSETERAGIDPQDPPPTGFFRRAHIRFNPRREGQAAQKQAKMESGSRRKASQTMWNKNWLPGRCGCQENPERNFFANLLEARRVGLAKHGLRSAGPTRLPAQPRNRGLELRLIGSLQSDAVHFKKRCWADDNERENTFPARPARVLEALVRKRFYSSGAQSGHATQTAVVPSSWSIILAVETARI